MNPALRADGLQGQPLLNAQRLLKFVCAAIRDCARANGGPTASEIPAAMLSMETLLEYRSQDRVPLPMTAQLAGKYGVIFYSDDKAARAMVKKLSPSFFVMMMPPWDALEHIHVLEGRLATLSGCLLVSYKVSPSKHKVKEVRRRLQKHLGAETGCPWVTTEPFEIDEESMPFTIGGNTKKSVMDNILTPLVRQALLQSKMRQKQQGGEESEIEQVKCALSGSERDPKTVVLWVRKSEAERKGKTSIPRQLWSILTSEAPPLMDLHLEDRVVVLIEYCSSAANPLSDRVVKDAVIPDRPVHLLTANPDRFTRRPEEIAYAYQRTGDDWHTQGLRSTPSPADWVRVKDSEDAVKEQVRIGRQGAEQFSFYQRMTQVKNRVIVAMEHRMPSPQIEALKHFVREAMIHHGITTIVIIICESPPADKKGVQSRHVATTNVRQDAFLDALLPGEIQKRYISLPSTSRYTSNEATRHVKNELASITGRAMLVSSTLDRVLRRRTYYDDLRALLSADGRGHMAMSFIWDTKTGVINVPDAMRLRPEV
jgi:hypothetical protein